MRQTAAPTDPNAIHTAIAIKRIRIGVILSSSLFMDDVAPRAESGIAYSEPAEMRIIGSNSRVPLHAGHLLGFDSLASPNTKLLRFHRDGRIYYLRFGSEPFQPPLSAVT